MSPPARTLRTAVSMSVVSFLALTSEVFAQPRTELGRRYPVSMKLDGAGLRKPVSHCAQGETARYMRARLRLRDGSQGRWYLTVRDSSHRPMEVLTPASFAADGTRWTMRVPGCRIQLELQLGDDSSHTRAVEVEVVEYLAMPDRARHPYYSVQHPGSPRYRGLFTEDRSAMRIRGETVGMVMSSYDQTSWCCSGVAVGENLFLTNWHCGAPDGVPDDLVWSTEVCGDTIVDLSWDGDAVSREFQCAAVLASDKDLDFALLELRPLSGQGPARPAPIRGSAPRAGEGIDVIHHPECLSKQITRGCSVESADWPSWVTRRAGVDVAHRCDTEEGSSGGAVFDSAGKLVALHHRGFARTSDPEAHAQKLNTAVRLDRILEFLDSCSAGTPDCVPNLRRRLEVE